MKRKIQLLYIVCLCLVCLKSYPQNHLYIKGKVSDLSGQPVAYSTVFIKKLITDSVPLISKIADEQGEFHVESLASGDYLLIIEQVGFKRYNLSINLRESIDLDTIQLTEDSNLIEGVVVRRTIPAITRKIDRVVLNVESLSAAAGRSALDIFRMAPGVSVIQNNIAIHGVQGARVMVDNRLLNLSGQDLIDYLQSLKPENIQSIEVIARPSAEFDAEGTGGLINIILKKQRESGIHARLGHDFSQGLGKFASYRPFAGLDYSSGKLALSVDYAYSNSKNFENLEQRRTLSDLSEYANTTTSDIENINQRFRFYGAYDFTENHLISMDYTARFMNNDRDMSSFTQIIAQNENQNVFSDGDFPIVRNTNYHNVGLNYTWKTNDSGSKLQVIADYTINNTDAVSSTNSVTYDFNRNPTSDTTFNFRFPSDLQLFTTEVKYDHRFASNWSLLFGGKLASAKIDNNNTYDILRDDTWNYGQDAFDFLYNERVTAAFANLRGSFLGTEILLGLRAEHSDINGDLTSELQDSSVRQNYLSLFPSLHLQKKLDNVGNHLITLSANRRIRRPTYTEMNPYQYFVDNYTIVTGNPNLQPQFITGIDVNYLLRQKYQIGGRYSNTKDIINQVFILEPNSANVIINRANTGTAERFAITGSAPIKVAAWWDSNSNVELSYSTSVAPEFNLSIYSYMLQTNHNFKIGKGYTANLTAYYTPKMLFGNLITESMGTVDMGFRKKLFDDKLVAAVSVSDLFYTSNFSGLSYYNKETIWVQNLQQTREFSISLTYNFAVGKGVNIRKQEKSNQEESGRF